MQFLAIIPLLFLLAWAAASDFKTRRIPNWLNFAMILSGWIVSALGTGAVGVTDSLEATAIGFAIGFVLFVLGALRGGDVKLITGLGAWLGSAFLIKILIVEKVVGLVIVLVQCGTSGKLGMLFRNSAILAMNLSQVSEIGVRQVREDGQTFRSIDRPLPYAVPILVAVMIVLCGWV